MRVQRTGRSDPDRVHLAILPDGFYGLDNAIEHARFCCMRACALVIKRGDIIWLISGGTDMCPADIYGNDEAHSLIIIEPAIRHPGVGRK